MQGNMQLVWTVLAAAVAIAGLVLAWRSLLPRKPREPRCPACGYDMSGVFSTGQTRCPECGLLGRSMRTFYKRRRAWRLGAVGLALVAGSWWVHRLPAMRARGWPAAIPTWCLVAFWPIDDIVDASSAPRRLSYRIGTPVGDEALLRFESQVLPEVLQKVYAKRCVRYLNDHPEVWRHNVTGTAAGNPIINLSEYSIRLHDFERLWVALRGDIPWSKDPAAVTKLGLKSGQYREYQTKVAWIRDQRRGLLDFSLIEMSAQLERRSTIIFGGAQGHVFAFARSIDHDRIDAMIDAMTSTATGPFAGSAPFTLCDAKYRVYNICGAAPDRSYRTVSMLLDRELRKQNYRRVRENNTWIPAPSMLDYPASPDDRLLIVIDDDAHCDAMDKLLPLMQREMFSPDAHERP